MSQVRKGKTAKGAKGAAATPDIDLAQTAGEVLASIGKRISGGLQALSQRSTEGGDAKVGKDQVNLTPIPLNLAGTPLRNELQGFTPMSQFGSSGTSPTDDVQRMTSGGGGAPSARTSLPGNFGFTNSPPHERPLPQDNEATAADAVDAGVAEPLVAAQPARAVGWHLPVSRRGAAYAGVAAVLISLLVMTASNYHSGWQAQRAFESLREHVASLHQTIAARQQASSQSAALGADVQAGLAESRTAYASLQRQVEDVLSRLMGTQKAVDVHEQQLEQVRTTLASAAASQQAEDDAAQLARLPSCHIRRLEGAAGPVLPARVVAHSEVVGDKELLMQFHKALSKIFKTADQRVHPLARQIVYPTAAPACLPLSGSEGGSLEVQLPVPSNITAVSFVYPDMGSWDASGALRGFSLMLHEVDVQPTRHAARNGQKGGDPSGQPQPQERLVDMPSVRSLPCQTLTVPASVPGKLVVRLTLLVDRNFGNTRFTCVPKILLHGSKQ